MFEPFFRSFPQFVVVLYWVNDGLDELYKIVTGQEADIEQLHTIEDLFRFYD